MKIPGGDRIQVGTLLAVNYAGYHLPPWCYFREKWPEMERGDSRPPVECEHASLKKLGGEDTFLSRSHEFVGSKGADSERLFEYIVKRDPHHVSTWQKFVSDDNEELLPPTMDEDSFATAKLSFRKLVDEHGAPDKMDQLIEKLGELSEYEFQGLLDSCLPLFPSEAAEGLLEEIRGYRWQQERVLMEEMCRRVEAVLSGEDQFLSLQERRVGYKEVDRLAQHLVAQRMRFQVRGLEICDARRYMGLEEDECCLEKILGSMETKLEIDIEGPIKGDQGSLGDRIDSGEIERVRGRIGELRACLRGDGGQRYPSFLEELGSLESHQESCEKFKREVEKVLELAEYLPGQEVTWQEYRERILAMEEEERNELIENSLRILRDIHIEEVQKLESEVNQMRGRVGAVEKGVKETEQLILKFEERLVIKEDKQSDKKQQQQQQQAPAANTILSFKKQLPKSPLEVDDLNSYLRYPPIYNRLELHEGYWPPLRNVGSEGTVSVWKEDPSGSGKEKKEFNNVKLSHLIGRFDEAFTLFSSTLADHGMPRPVPEPRPIKFRYGLGEVVPAWDHATKGISEMKLGEIRIMMCPSLTAYGDRGVPESVPPFMPLLYVIRMDGIYAQEDDNYESDDDIPLDELVV